MSLAEKWEEYVKRFPKRFNSESNLLALREAFYAGAEADCYEESMSVKLKERLAEIDHFRSHK